ncbi:MAG: DUF1549 domain-containing protein, partial [Phycisphaerae bacterium]|nr:DUF1549 domain-containing protein [Phycisphaerae bacterium]
MVERHAISHRLMPFVLTAIAALLAPAKPAGANVSFRLDVMPILSKAGCNAGKCHGNARGRGGFKLSLWGDRPGDDLKALTDNRQSSRVNLDRAAHSLVLRKPTRQVKHEGGVRFEVDSPEYRVLHDWIVAGAKPDPPNAATLTELEVKTPATVLADPVDRLQLKVTATLSDGTRRDVSSLAVYEPSNLSAAVKAGGLVQRLTFGETTIRVRYLHLQRSVTLAFIPARPDFKWADPPVANDVDRHVFTKLKRLRINPSPLCDDRTFLRRAHLDITGRLPGAAESAAFLADTASGKRTRLIDDLLGRDAYADHWALKWADLLRVEEKVLDRRGVRVFHEWIRNSIAENKPLDQFARELLTAMGSTYKNPPANYYRALRTARHRAEATAQVFAGIRLGCARCHNHPYERWTQDDYY